MREWSRYHDESEWSLIVSLMCSFCKRSFRRILRSCFSRWAVRHALQQSRGGAMFRGGSFDQLGGCQELHEEWRMRRLAELSSDDLTQEEPADVSPIAWNRSRSPQRWGLKASAKHSRQRLLRWCSWCRAAMQHR